jgi:hypothetical protein
VGRTREYATGDAEELVFRNGPDCGGPVMHQWIHTYGT